MADVFIPKAGFTFLKQLKKNNNRDWFQSHRENYENDLKIPLQRVIVDLGKTFGKKAPQIEFNAKKAIFRINRDTRFSNNKDPYKTNIGAFFVSYRQHKKEDFPGLYLHIEPGNCFIAGGLYMPSGEQLRKIRELIQRDPEAFQKIITHPKVKKYFGGLTGEKLKTAPRGMAADHPQIELLRWKQFIFIKRYADQDFQSGSLSKKVEKEFAAILPLVDWLNKALALW